MRRTCSTLRPRHHQWPETDRRPGRPTASYATGRHLVVGC